MSTLRVPHHPTLWEQGHQTGFGVAFAATSAAALAVIVDLLLSGSVALVFDLAFVTICVAAALAVRRRNFYQVGLLPPVLMGLTILVLVLQARGSVAEPEDGLVQALVSGLAHHAGALVAGHVLTLTVLTIRQVALRHAGMLREPAHVHDQADEQQSRRDVRGNPGLMTQPPGSGCHTRVRS